jgi:hypothetical protein
MIRGWVTEIRGNAVFIDLVFSNSWRLWLRTLSEPSPSETRTPQAGAYVRAASGEFPE